MLATGDMVIVEPEQEIERLLTGDELLEMGDIGPCELIDGRIVAMPPAGVEHGILEFDVGSRLRDFVTKRNLGWVTGGEAGIYVRRNPDRLRGMDVAFISKTRHPARPRKFLEVAPELIVEIVSPTDRWSDVLEKLEEYFAIGVDRVWIVDPASKTVRVFRSSVSFVKLSEVDTLRGDGVLEGFELPLRELFAE